MNLLSIGMKSTDIPPTAATPGKTGRPRTFDADQALDSAMRVFWEKGYEGSSLPELTKAMGMNRPSLYAVFGNKEQLFRKALERYESTRMQYYRDALAAPAAREVVERVLRNYVDRQTEPDKPHGCLGINGALACGDDALPVRNELIARRQQGEAELRARLQRAGDEGDLPRGSNPEQLARYVMTVAQGLAVQASGGATRQQLHEVIDVVMAGWPT